MHYRGALAACVAMLVAPACGPPSSDPGSLGTSTSNVRIHFAGAGRGTIRSTSPAFDCTAECTQMLPAGTHLHLVAVPSSGSAFGAWTGACSGAADCDFTASGNPDVLARFDIAGQPPPVQGQVVVDVQITGQGAVTSTPPGIDCGSSCHATFTSDI